METTILLQISYFFSYSEQKTLKMKTPNAGQNIQQTT